MNPLTIRRRGTAASVLLASLGAGLAPQAGSGTDPPGGEEGVVTVLDEGEPAGRVLLAAPVAEGAAADSTMTTNLEITVNATGFSVDLELDSTLTRSIDVRSTGVDGSYVAVETIASFEHTVSDTDGEALDPGFVLDDDQFSDFTPLVGTPLVVEYGPDHEILSVEPDRDVIVTAEQSALIDAIAADGFGFGSIAGLLPDVPVGQGARWMVAAPDSPPGITVPVEMAVTLADVTGEDYTLAIAMAADIADLQGLDAETEGFDELGGVLTLTGTVDGDITDALAHSVAAHIAMNLTFVSADMSATMHVALDIAEASTPR